MEASSDALVAALDRSDDTERARVMAAKDSVSISTARKVEAGKIVQACDGLQREDRLKLLFALARDDTLIDMIMMFEELNLPEDDRLALLLRYLEKEET